VFLGYLTCSDYCPLRLQQLRELAALWPAETSPPLRFLFITLDPAHDTPAQRREIIDGQGPQMFSATLTADALQQLQQQLREQVAVRDGAISHAGNLYLLDGERRLRRVYPATELSPAALLEDIRQLDAGAHTPVQLQ
jgi:cytochrome oxidase Cu insertion factor (SCO1/SenC/PrrC family)